MTDPATERRDARQRALTITRIFEAPRALVYKMWTEPHHMKRWWGPRGYTTLSAQVDMRLGGFWRVHSRKYDGTEVAEQGVFRQIVEAERLVFTHAWEEDDGSLGHETLVTVTFADDGDKTIMVFHQAEFLTIESRDGHLQGWGESFDMLKEYLGNA
ncbi:SRPBCC domain-containing protein [Mesorhizobium sp. PL10]